MASLRRPPLPAPPLDPLSTVHCPLSSVHCHCLCHCLCPSILVLQTYVFGLLRSRRHRVMAEDFAHISDICLGFPWTSSARKEALYLSSTCQPTTSHSLQSSKTLKQPPNEHHA